MSRQPKFPPAVTLETRHYRDGTGRSELLIQQCGARVHPPLYGRQNRGFRKSGEVGALIMSNEAP